MSSSRYAPPTHHPRQYATMYGRNPAQNMSPVHGGSYATMATGQKTGSGGKSPKPHNYAGTMIGNGSMTGGRPNGQHASQYILSPEVSDLKANAIATHV